MLAAAIYDVSNRGGFCADFGLRNQIRRASVSIMANIAEGFGRGGKPEFLRFLRIARASTLETQSHLYIALDLRYLLTSEFDALQNQSNRVTNLIGGLMNYLQHDIEPPKLRNRRTEELKNG